MADRKSEKTEGKIACQETGSRAQAYGAACRGIRVIWRKLDCLNPNLRKVQMRRPPERRLKPAPVPAAGFLEPAVILRELERCPVRAFKEMSGAPKSR